MITRENYEIWFIDYADGNLSTDEKAMVEAFMLANQDLAAEFEAIELVVVPVSHENYAQKSSLRRSENEQFIHEGNVEELVVLELDNELNNKTQIELNEYLIRHPQFAHLRDVYATTILPKETIVYENKAGLKRNNGAIRPIWYMLPIAAAASVALFIFFGQPIGKNTQNGNTAQQNIINIDTLKSDVADDLITETPSNQTADKLGTNTSGYGKNSNQQKDATPKVEDNLLVNNKEEKKVEEQIVPTKKELHQPLDSVIQPSPKIILENHDQVAGTITDPGKEDNKENVAANTDLNREPVTSRSGLVDLNKKETWLALAEKGLTKVSGKPAEIVSEKTDAKRSFKVKLGGFEFSRTKQR